MARSRRRRTAAGLTVTALLLAGGYVAADAADLVPGVLTTAPPVPDPAPFPEATAGAAEPLLPALDPDAPLPSAEAVTALTEELVADPRTGGAVAVVVRDALTDEVLADVAGDEPRTPASSLKLLGAVAALDALGPDHVLRTTAVEGEGNQVVLVGGGDILLTDGEASEDVVGHASLADLAAATAEALDGQEVSVAVDDTLFSGPGYAPGWGGIDLDYVMPIQPLALDAGLDADGEYVADPALAAGQAFADALRAEGVTVTGDVTRAQAPPGARELASVESAPLRDVVAYELAVSENSVAEVLARLVAIADGEEPTFEGAARAVLARLADLGIDTRAVTLADTSGLLVENQVPASVLADVTALALDPGRPDLRGAVTGLPVAALEGTLRGRMSGPAAGVLQAKTGTLTTAVSLTGLVQDADGRLLVFAVVADDLEPGGAAEARAAIDEWAAALAACGCR
ncbi:D-alanyl-D-alanine carboxypeptidase/D-alanyl-D-alanine-endopeptidase [Georgenia wutianyii]|uniref:D-alanyl-D-alanine carboxypeptidase/D-alanyl-D-alanine-endopeptidase n=1 Tax=Georgenia wutianyii TaxID=2585135 RepID=A0ABX5VR95_9MICO|nr:D-alanyl-D-alanine carboxypeptidase/D-alanyl-D-alanine-endopeptidase [Georgenia wutianyii]QDB80361.1 D-alanyl-D-alanine carboxypeptidase/D-alanyl-D-alanine-endopeptidase [Georgenia wutianyii]